MLLRSTTANDGFSLVDLTVLQNGGEGHMVAHELARENLQTWKGFSILLHTIPAYSSTLLSCHYNTVLRTLSSAVASTIYGVLYILVGY